MSTPPRARVGTAQDGPWCCWHCMKQLQLATGGGYFYLLVGSDISHHQNRIHVGCWDEVKADNPRMHIIEQP